MPQPLCASSSLLQTVHPGKMTFGEGSSLEGQLPPGRKPLFVCSQVSGLCLGRLKWDPCPQRSSGGPSFSLTDSAHSKNPFLFSEENSYAKHLADLSPTLPSEEGVYGWTWPGSNPILCLLICSCLGSPRSMWLQHQVLLISLSEDNGLLCPSVTICSLGAAGGTQIHLPNSTRKR